LQLALERAFSGLSFLFFVSGSGKLILLISSAIIQEVMVMREAGRASLGFFYCDFRDTNKQNRYSLLTSLLTQLAFQSDPFYEMISRLFSDYDDGAHKPNDASLMQCLRIMLSSPNQHPVYIIIDALDESPNTFGIPSPRE
jgi:hypothetical protein